MRRIFLDKYPDFVKGLSVIHDDHISVLLWVDNDGILHHRYPTDVNQTFHLQSPSTSWKIIVLGTGEFTAESNLSGTPRELTLQDGNSVDYVLSITDDGIIELTY